MDAIDLTIVGALVANARITFAELAELVGLSGPSTAERVRKLEQSGAVRGYAAILDAEVIGMGLAAFIAVTLESPGHRDGFVARIAELPNVVECHHVAGDDDYLLKVHADGTRGLEALVSDGLKAIPGVARTRTTVVLSTPLERPLAPSTPKASA